MQLQQLFSRWHSYSRHRHMVIPGSKPMQVSWVSYKGAPPSSNPNAVQGMPLDVLRDLEKVWGKGGWQDR